MSKPELHDPLDLGYTDRLLSNTEHTLTHLADGRIELRIWHDFLEGITADMLEWWFQNFDQAGKFQGLDVPWYRLWHPRDHIQVQVERNAEGRVVAGGHLHIQEAFGRNMDFLINQKAEIHRLDRGGIGFHVHKVGHRIMELDHVWRERKDGLIYESCMRIGASSGPLRGLIDKRVLPHEFGPEKAQAWLTHNVEEVGYLPLFLPQLYAQEQA